MLDLKKYQIIIIGSGIASQAIIKKLNPNKKVLVIEGGTSSENSQSEKLTENNEYGHFSNGWWQRHWVRAYGGTSRRWSGWVATLDKRDFEGHNGLPKWPISRSELTPYYPEAASFLNRDVSILDFDLKTNINDDFSFKPFSNGNPRRFIDVNELKKFPNVDLILGANLIRLASKDRKVISGLWIYENGKEVLYELTANQIIILACGGLGNAQILLQPTENSVVPIGNESGLAGRYLMEHPHAHSASILLNKKNIPQVGKSFGFHTRAFIPSDSVYLQHKLLACTIAIEDIAKGLEIESKEQEYFEKKLNASLERVNGYARGEQQPQFNNHVEIINQKNWAGLYKLRTQCAFSNLDLYTIDMTTRLFGEYLYKNQLGILKIHNQKIYRESSGGGHTMGTTKMGFTIKDSVCDSKQRAHGYKNLYIAGSSVFTTSGASNPTITIVALSFRLADHLNSTVK